MKKARVTKLQLRSTNRQRKKPRKKPRKKIETQYVEGRGGWVVSIGIVLILVSLLLPYQMWNLGVPSESPTLFSGLSMISDIPGNIDYILWTIEEGGLVQYVIALELLAPTVFLITAILTVRYRGSEKLASYRKSDDDNLAVVRIVGKFHLLYFAASIIAMLIYYRNDILLGATQLLPIDDGDAHGNWGLGFWLGGLSGILIAYPERIAVLTIGEIPGYVIRDVWKGIKDPWIWFAGLWTRSNEIGTSDVAFTSSFDEVRYPPVYYTSIIVTMVYSAGFMIAISIIIFTLAAIWIVFGDNQP